MEETSNSSASKARDRGRVTTSKENILNGIFLPLQYFSLFGNIFVLPLQVEILRK